MRFIGDVHGKFKQYKRFIADCEASIQVGDLGVGFFRNMGGERVPTQNPPYDAMTRGNHRFIRGNHDNPFVCRNHSQWIADGIVENDVMFCGGALSIDKDWRTEGYDWWPEEELTYGEFSIVAEVFATARPRIMVTHECPEAVATIMCALSGRRKLDLPSITRQAFQAMFERHQPRIWIYGHWHFPFDLVIEGTRFICLAELQTIDIDV